MLVTIAIVDEVLLSTLAGVVNKLQLSHGHSGLLQLLCLAAVRHEHHLEVGLPSSWSSLGWPPLIRKDTVSDWVSLGSIVSGGNGLEASEAALFTPAGWRKSDRNSPEWNPAEEPASLVEFASSTVLGWDMSNVGVVLLVAGDMSDVNTALVSVGIIKPVGFILVSTLVLGTGGKELAPVSVLATVAKYDLLPSG